MRRKEAWGEGASSLGWNQSNLPSLEEKASEKGTSWVEELLPFGTCQAQAAPIGGGDQGGQDGDLT